MDDPSPSPDIIGALARLRDELATLRLIERHLEQHLRLRDRPNEDGDPRDLKKALSKIRGKIRRLESRIGRKSR